MPNYYEILGVSKDASESEIKKAFRTLSLIHHPDRGGDTHKFQEISAAYETLSDPAKKQEYDMESNGIPGGVRFTHMSSMDEFSDINNIINMMFGGMGGMAGMGGFPGMHGMPPGMGGPNIRVFHNGVPVNGGGMFHNIQKPQPIIKNIKITLEQAYNGMSYPIEVERVIQRDNIRYNENETIYVNIPRGIDDNESIIVKDKGHIINDVISGDIKINISIENTTDFKRNGLDMIYKKNITLKEALCGFTFDIMHLSGKQICLNNKVNTTIIRPNYKKIVPNMGFIRDSNVGNWIIEFEIIFPDSLSEEKIAQLSEIL